MATSVATPAPAAPAPAAATPAPSTPAPSTPAAAPATPAPASQAAPSTVSTETTPAAQPSTPAQPAAAAPAGKPEPKQADFPGDIVGFLDAHSAWEREQSGEVPAQAEEKPAEAAAQQAEGEAKPAEGEAQQADEQDLEEPQAVTPEVLNGFLQKSEALKNALEADPAIKNALFQMARVNAKAAPILEIFPSKESAQYAAEQSNTMVSLRSSFLEAIDSPESFPKAFDQFAEQFAQRDKDGNVVKDAEGFPVYDDDFHMLNDYIVDTYHDVEIADLEAAINAGQFGTDAERDNADMALQAFKFIKDWKAGKYSDQKPSLDNLPPDVKAYYERKEAELAEKEAKLGGDQKQQNATQRQQERQNYEVSVNREIGSSVGKRMDGWIKEKQGAGVFIPSYVLSAKDPKTGISVFAQTVLNKFLEATYGRTDAATGKVIGGDPFIRNQATMLSRRPPSDEAKQDRINFNLKLMDDVLRPIFDSELRSIQRQAVADSKKRAGSQEAREQLTEREPRGGQPHGGPKTLTPEEAMKEAYRLIDQEQPDLSPRERMEKALVRKDQLLSRR